MLISSDGPWLPFAFAPRGLMKREALIELLLCIALLIVGLASCATVGAPAFAGATEALQESGPSVTTVTNIDPDRATDGEAELERGGLVYGGANVQFGLRYPREGAFSESEELSGVQGDLYLPVRDQNWGLELGGAYFEAERGEIDSPTLGSGKLEVRQVSFALGVRAAIPMDAWELFVGGGFEHTSGSRIARKGRLSTRESDGVGGGYVHVGLIGRVREELWIGVDYRHFRGEDFEFVGADVVSDYDQVSLVVGLRN